MNHRLRTLWLGLGVFVLSGVTVGADVLHLKTGGRLEGVLVAETPALLTIDVGMGRLSIPRTSVSRIERKESALSQYRTRLAETATGDVAALADLARFAAENGLRSESRLMWARVVALDPRHVEAHRALGHVLVNGRFVDEDEANRANGLVQFEGRWVTPVEQASLLREREQRTASEMELREARRSAREAEDRARRAEREAERARAEARASQSALPIWGYGTTPIFGGRHWGSGYGAGCSTVGSCNVAPMWPQPPAVPAATPLPRTPPLKPSSIR